MTTQTNSIRIVEAIDFRPQDKRILAHLGIGESEAPAFLPEIHELLSEAQAVARPKGMYKLSTVDHPAGEEGVSCIVVDGLSFSSRVLAVNLAEVQRAFPYIATCGREMDEWSESIDDPMKRFWADAIKEEALRLAIEGVAHDLVKTYRPGERATMNPGSLEDWPLSEQRNLFSLFGDAVNSIGVSLSESFLMIPIKSVSGIWFETETGFQSCQLCPREQCPNRRAPYDPHLFGERYKD